MPTLTRLSRFLAGVGHLELPRYLIALRRNPGDVSAECLWQLAERRVITRTEYLRAIAECELAPDHSVTVAGHGNGNLRFTFRSESEFSRDRVENGFLVDRDGTGIMNFRMLKAALQRDPSQVFVRAAAGNPIIAPGHQESLAKDQSALAIFRVQAKQALLLTVQGWFPRKTVTSMHVEEDRNASETQSGPAAIYHVADVNVFVLEAAVTCRMENVEQLTAHVARAKCRYPEPVVGVLMGRWFGPGVVDAASDRCMVGTLAGSSVEGPAEGRVAWLAEES
eukprot:NODE_3242_length_1017_cov_27.916322_g2980_i0.p1 GENE.NODE_3242_length_1017_cov_27.916322_g2980_i0~~NODE_3242_length_1017_cov_27.916322_g2980_i0.p1  ORF type:complete len:280 (-),score=36.81 NODE_3242_length_1017_cov_27.916322_g2980_i0:79-918(-)